MHEFLVGFYGNHAAPLVLRHMEAWRDAVLESSPAGACSDVIDAHICPRKLDKHANATVRENVFFASFLRLFCAPFDATATPEYLPSQARDKHRKS